MPFRSWPTGPVIATTIGGVGIRHHVAKGIGADSNEAGGADRVSTSVEPRRCGRSPVPARGFSVRGGAKP